MLKFAELEKDSNKTVDGLPKTKSGKKKYECQIRVYFTLFLEEKSKTEGLLQKIKRAIFD